jgi:integrase
VRRAGDPARGGSRAGGVAFLPWIHRLCRDAPDVEEPSVCLLRLFRGVPAAKVRGTDVLRYANLRLEEKAAPATVNRELAALRAAYRLGLESDVILSMPRIKLLPENNVRKGFADADRVEGVCRRLQSDVADAVRFMFITGWRSRSEVLPLTWDQVDFAGGFVRLEPGTTKNSEGRSFPLIPELRRLLERRQDLTRRCERGQGRIIPQVFHRYGRPIRSIRRTWLTACRKAGIPALRPHDLRRSAVRNLERAGVSRSVAMKLTGHKTENVYRRYAIVAENDLREAGVQAGRGAPECHSFGDNFRDN